MLAVEQIVYEDYENYFGFIFPLGEAKRKELTADDLRKAFKKFLKLKCREEVLAFARDYGLLNNYELRVTEGGVWIYNVFFREGFRLRYVDTEHDIIFIPRADRIWIPFREDQKPEGAYIISRSRPVSVTIEEIGININPAKGLGESVGFDTSIKEDSNEDYIIAEGWEYVTRCLSSMKLAKDYRNYLKDIAIKPKRNRELEGGEGKGSLLGKFLRTQIGENKNIRFSGLTLRYDVQGKIKSGKTPKGEIKNVALVFPGIVDAFLYLIHTDDNLRICPYCGDIFVLEDKRGRKNRFCSSKCKRRFHYEHDKAKTSD